MLSNIRKRSTLPWGVVTPHGVVEILLRYSRSEDPPFSGTKRHLGDAQRASNGLKLSANSENSANAKGFLQRADFIGRRVRESPRWGLLLVTEKVALDPLLQAQTLERTEIPARLPLRP